MNAYRTLAGLGYAAATALIATTAADAAVLVPFDFPLTGDVVLIPEPASLALFGLGAALIAWRRREQRDWAEHTFPRPRLNRGRGKVIRFASIPSMGP